MNRDDVIRMAQEAGIVVIGEAAFKLCQLVAQHEREACAEIVVNEAMQYAEPVWAFEIVNDIKARGQA
jgi:hypothetical protein